jgi:outer membrane protein TolC
VYCFDLCQQKSLTVCFFLGERELAMKFVLPSIRVIPGMSGVASAAFYPSLIFGAGGGFQSRDFGAVFNGPSSLWSLGVTATQTLFDGGRIQSNVDFTRAGYELAVANYRRVVLTAMQEVEDGISSVSAIDRAYTQAQKATDSNRRVLQIAQDRYQGGIANSQDVIIAQQSQLNSERLAAQLLGQRLLTSVFLIKALGGDWQASSVAVSASTPAH